MADNPANHHENQEYPSGKREIGNWREQGADIAAIGQPSAKSHRQSAQHERQGFTGGDVDFLQKGFLEDAGCQQENSGPQHNADVLDGNLVLEQRL